MSEAITLHRVLAEMRVQLAGKRAALRRAIETGQPAHELERKREAIKCLIEAGRWMAHLATHEQAIREQIGGPDGQG